MSRTTINPCLGNWVIVFVWLLILSHFHSLFLLLHPGALVLIGNDATVWLNVSRSLEQQWSIMLIRTSGICGALNTNRSLWYSDSVFFFLRDSLIIRKVYQTITSLSFTHAQNNSWALVRLLVQTYCSILDVEASCLTLAYLLTCANCAGKILSEPQHVFLVVLIQVCFWIHGLSSNQWLTHSKLLLASVPHFHQ